MTSMQPLCDRTLYYYNRMRSAKRFAQYDFLHKQAEMRIAERLDGFARTFDHVLVVGAASTELSHHPKLRDVVYADYTSSRLPAADIVMDEEIVPLQSASLDAICCVLNLHMINDLPGTLIQLRRALKPDGLLLAVTMGARTLQELRHALTLAETAHYGGISPHIIPFLEVRDAGSLLQRAGFALPVVDNELLTISYENANALMQELHAAGEGNCLHGRKNHMTGKQFMHAVQEAYAAYYTDDEQRITATAELLILTAWAPSDKQQKPLARGSGKVHLTSVFE